MAPWYANAHARQMPLFDSLLCRASAYRYRTRCLRQNLFEECLVNVPRWLLQARTVSGGGPSSEERGMAEAYLESLVNYEAKGLPSGAGTDSEEGFQLARVHRLMEKLGDPVTKYKVVHVAGSKGKGSTTAFLSEILRSAGLRVGTYTSPHVRELRERIHGPTGQPITRQGLDDLVARHREVLHRAQQEERGRLTHFEVLTALAYTHFAEERVEVAVIETGLGGLRDATNVVPRASLAAAVLTSLGWEHVEALGGSLESIARAKAGIIKEGCPVVLAQQAEPVAEAVVRAEAARLHAPVLSAAPPAVEWHSRGPVVAPSGVYDITLSDITLSTHVVRAIASAVQGGQKQAGQHDPRDATPEEEQAVRLQGVRLGLLGPHQHSNASCALVAALVLREQGWAIPDSALRQGLESARLPGRFQVLSAEESAALGTGEATVVLDGAHTAASAAALASTLRTVFPGWRLLLLVAMASDKDHSAFASALLRGVRPEAVICTQVSIAGSASRSMPATELLRAFESAAKEQAASGEPDSTSSAVNFAAKTQMEAAVTEAGRRLLGSGMGEKNVICITGSLHAVGAVLSIVEEPK